MLEQGAKINENNVFSVYITATYSYIIATMGCFQRFWFLPIIKIWGRRRFLFWLKIFQDPYEPTRKPILHVMVWRFFLSQAAPEDGNSVVAWLHKECSIADGLRGNNMMQHNIHLCCHLYIDISYTYIVWYLYIIYMYISIYIIYIWY